MGWTSETRLWMCIAQRTPEYVPVRILHTKSTYLSRTLLDLGGKEEEANGGTGALEQMEQWNKPGCAIGVSMGVERVEWSQDCAGQGHHGDPGPAAIFSCSSVFSLAFFPLPFSLRSALSISARLRITVRYYAMPLSAGGAKLTGPDRSTSQTRAVTVSLALTPAPAPKTCTNTSIRHHRLVCSSLSLSLSLVDFVSCAGPNAGAWDTWGLGDRETDTPH